jgi:prefoldin subunit 5
MADTIETLREQISLLREQRATHAEQINAIATRVNEMSNDIKTILGYMERTKGSWKTLVVLGSAAAAVVEGVHQIVDFFHK